MGKQKIIQGKIDVKTSKYAENKQEKAKHLFIFFAAVILIIALTLIVSKVLDVIRLNNPGIAAIVIY